MIYTVEELRKLIAQNEIAEAARFCGMSYSTMWRIFNGQQEPKESTLIALKKYVELV
jgi:predicted DNA-binding transcriptional regulator AlpA